MSDSDIDKALDQEYPESIRFEEPGQKVIGTFVRLESGVVTFNNESRDVRIVVLDVDGTEKSVWLIHEALLSQFKRARPRIGQRVGVKYFGKVKSAGGFNYHNYRVATEQAEGADVDWDAIDSEPMEDFDQGSNDTNGEWATPTGPSESSSNWSSSAEPEPEPSEWATTERSLEHERARFAELNRHKSSREIYSAARRVFEESGLGTPASRDAVANADAGTLGAINDLLAEGAF